MEKDNFFIKSQLEQNINDVERLLSTGIFNADVLRPFQEPTFVSIILKLDDQLQKFRILGKRISFVNDIASGDITDLVNSIRNAICHLNSPENIVEDTQLKFVFCMVVGKGKIAQFGDKILETNYSDDIAFFYGDNRIYLKRHIIRIIEDSKKIYQEIYPNN